MKPETLKAIDNTQGLMVAKYPGYMDFDNGERVLLCMAYLADAVKVRTEVAKRVLDFSYGFACGSGASVRELGDRVFIVLPVGCEVKETDLAKLRKDGYLKQ